LWKGVDYQGNNRNIDQLKPVIILKKRNSCQKGKIEKKKEKIDAKPEKN